MLDLCLHNHIYVLVILLVGVFTADVKSGSEYSEVDETTEAKEMEEVAPESGSNEGLESSQENVEDENNDQSSQRTFSYDQLKTTSGKNVPGIDLERREVSLSFNYYKHLKMGQILQVPPMNFPSPLILLNFLFSFGGYFNLQYFKF